MSFPVEDACARGTVHVVERNAEQREFLCRLLGTGGFDVIAFDSAEEFLDNVELDQPGAVVSELNLGRMSGFTLLQALRRRAAASPPASSRCPWPS